MDRTLVNLVEAHTYKVVIVDDSMSMRRWLNSVISQDSRLEIVGAAGTAEEARSVINQTNPDVLTLDIEMPGINGLEFLAHLMRLRPMPVVMLAGAIEGKSIGAERARSLGAAACMAKPSFPTGPTMHDLCQTLVDAATGRLPAASTSNEKRSGVSDKLIMVGASTGGVPAIETFLEQLPKDSPPVVIAQHMPHGFLRTFVNRMDQSCVHQVGFARDDMRLEIGTVNISPSQDMQTSVFWRNGSWHIKHVKRRNGHLYCPSVDVLFTSGVPWAPQIGAAILTGLGDDGARGMLALRRNGACTIGQSKESCVVYGMPGAAFSLNAVQVEAPIDEIASILLARLNVKDLSGVKT
ncbi:MAG: chemotaxis protein CheB [Tateyamaria sp.]|uniref:chemotaxis protein CheB n=2 Tax=Tateyamaria sp. TaxID=1929288 RepID=UPI00329D56A9